jgi:hypothetical protein
MISCTLLRCTIKSNSFIFIIIIIIIVIIIIIIIPFTNWGPLALAYSDPELASEIINPFRQLVRLLGRGIGPSLCLYLHKTTHHRKTRTYTHASSEIRTHNPSIQVIQDIRALNRAPLGPAVIIN